MAESGDRRVRTRVMVGVPTAALLISDAWPSTSSASSTAVKASLFRRIRYIVPAASTTTGLETVVRAIVSTSWASSAVSP